MIQSKRSMLHTEHSSGTASVSGLIGAQSYLVVALMTVIFSLPVCTGNALLHYLFYLAFFAGFAAVVPFITRSNSLSPIVRLYQYHRLTFLVLLAFGLSSAVSLIITIGENEGFRQFMALTRYLSYAIACCYVFALARFLMFKQFSLANIFLAYLAGTVFLAVLFLLVYHLSPASNAAEWGTNPPFGRNIRLMGMGAAVAVVSGVAVLCFDRRPGFVWLGILLAVMISNAFLIWTGSRTSTVVALLVSLALVILAGLFRKVSLGMFVAALLGLALSFPLSWPFSVFPWSGLERSIKDTAIEAPVAVAQDEQALYEAADRWSTGRVAIWDAAIEAWQQAPWFGHGPNATFFVLQYKKPIDQPHNLVLQFLVEWGLVGASLLLWLLAIFAWQGLKNLPAALRGSDVDYLLSAAVIAVLVLNGLTDGSFYHLHTVLCLATAFAVFPFRPVHSPLDPCCAPDAGR